MKFNFSESDIRLSGSLVVNQTEAVYTRGGGQQLWFSGARQIPPSTIMPLPALHLFTQDRNRCARIIQL